MKQPDNQDFRSGPGDARPPQHQPDRCYIILVSHFRLKHWPMDEAGPAAVITRTMNAWGATGFSSYMSAVASGNHGFDESQAEARFGWHPAKERAVAVVSALTPYPRPKDGDLPWFTAWQAGSIMAIRAAFTRGADLVAVHKPHHEFMFPGEAQVAIAQQLVAGVFGAGAVYRSEKLRSQIIGAIYGGERSMFE